ncbi:hypothetical protein K0M31_019298 [Melipona bicolor]|uniref:Uncharacterized protein n=1 Tax=Melipona bicolor TaxID=60889 RepID=A0AA40KR20_9HYME|nr:hypothetical protein K0M31_019298 [Melipona bicolor]
MWSVLISTELNEYRIMVDFYGYKSSAPSDRALAIPRSFKEEHEESSSKEEVSAHLRTTKQLLAQKQ